MPDRYILKLQKKRWPVRCRVKIPPKKNGQPVLSRLTIIRKTDEEIIRLQIEHAKFLPKLQLKPKIFDQLNLYNN